MATQSNAVWNKIAENWGALFNAGKLKIHRSDDATLAEYTFAASAFGTPTGGRVILAGIPTTVTGATAGVAHHATIASGAYQATGMSVGLSNAHVILNTLNFEAGKDVQLKSFYYQAKQTIGKP